MPQASTDKRRKAQKPKCYEDRRSGDHVAKRKWKLICAGAYRYSWAIYLDHHVVSTTWASWKNEKTLSHKALRKSRSLRPMLEHKLRGCDVRPLTSRECRRKDAADLRERLSD